MMNLNFHVVLSVLLFLLVLNLAMATDNRPVFVPDSEINRVPPESYNITDNTRFLIYDVNIGEGFNLRRDIFTRAATLVKHMNERDENWILVLPEWRQFYHWKTKEILQESIPYGQYFDVPSMNLHVPVMEFHDFWVRFGSKNGIDQIFNLLRPPIDDERRKNTPYISNCTERHYYKPQKNGEIRGMFFGGSRKVYGRKFDCLFVSGRSISIADFLQGLPDRYIYIDRFERLHHNYIVPRDSMDKKLDELQARRSMVFAKHLRKEADVYRKEFLDSSDGKDKTFYNDEDWRFQLEEEGSALGGPYIGLHMRRNDYVKAHEKSIPSIKEFGTEVQKKLDEYHLDKVFVATDGTDGEIEELQSYITGKIYRYPFDREEVFQKVLKYSDGGIAVIDQWIVAHARYYIPTTHSTFSQRISEERDILGFNSYTSYGYFCGAQALKDQCRRLEPQRKDRRETFRQMRIELANKLRKDHHEVPDKEL